MRLRAIFATAGWLSLIHGIADAQEKAPAPSIRTYKTAGEISLKAHVFQPLPAVRATSRAAIILLHGGGWSAGSPEWTYDEAMRYASLGLVAIAGQYRLSDQKTITPLEAMADARDLIRWVRGHAPELGVDPNRIAVYGYSAGGHLAASAAVFPHPEEGEISAVPDALILLSPGVAIVDDGWPQVLLGKRANVKQISPAENIKSKLPPTIIFEGDADTVTPQSGIRHFCARAKEMGGECQLHLYQKVGHLLSRNLDPHAQEQGPFDPDPGAVSDMHTRTNEFLTRIGFIK
jgi:acetyl esterase